MAKSKKSLARGSDFTRTYKLLGGSLLTSENMYIDPERPSDGLVTLPGFRLFSSFEGKINGLFKERLESGEMTLLVHAGNTLTRLSESGERYEIGYLKNVRSTSFSHAGNLYILDGEKIAECLPSGVVRGIADYPYLPTTYKNGEPYEERNLLTRFSHQVYEVATAEEYAYGSPELLFSIIDSSSHSCAVSGIDRTAGGVVYVPSYKLLGGTRYAVTEILPHALEGAAIEELIVSEGVEKIGDNALRGCKSLRRVTLPTSVAEIGKYAFASCTALEYVRIGLGLLKVGTAPFSNCPTLEAVAYEGDAAQLTHVEGYEALTVAPIEYNVAYTSVSVAFSTYGSGFFATDVYIDGIPHAFTSPKRGEIRLELDYKSELEGRTVKISGYEIEELGYKTDELADFISQYGEKISPDGAILGCTVGAVLDGRIFLTGNPKIPGAIFHSSAPRGGESTALYFGSYSFLMTDSAYPTAAMLATGGTLTVARTDGSLFTLSRAKEYRSPYHTRYKISAETSLAGGIEHGALIGGEPYIISHSELYALSGADKLRRTGVRILEGGLDSGEIFSTEWQGYLLLSMGGKCSLIDSRDTARHFPLSGIGSYKNSTRVYVYSDFSHHGLQKANKSGDVDYKEVISELLDDGRMIYYVVEDGKRLAVEPTEELSCGSFHPATAAVAIDKRLYFGTESGDVCIFNNDMRGIAPSRLAAASDFDPDEYERTMGDKIHPDFYDFMGERIDFSLTVKPDVCDAPSEYKITSREGVVLSADSEGATLDYTTVRDGKSTLSRRLNLGRLDFSRLDFGALALTGDSLATIGLDEDKEPWISHTISIRAAGFRSVAEIKALTLGYKIGRKIRG